MDNYADFTQHKQDIEREKNPTVHILQWSMNWCFQPFQD